MNETHPGRIRRIAKERRQSPTRLFFVGRHASTLLLSGRPCRLFGGGRLLCVPPCSLADPLGGADEIRGRQADIHGVLHRDLPCQPEQQDAVARDRVGEDPFRD